MFKQEPFATQHKFNVEFVYYHYLYYVTFMQIIKVNTYYVCSLDGAVYRFSKYIFTNLFGGKRFVGFILFAYFGCLGVKCVERDTHQQRRRTGDAQM